MPVISIEITKTIDERGMQKKNKQNKKKKQRQKEVRETEATTKGWELNDSVVHLS